jgi:hypothetical protein
MPDIKKLFGQINQAISEVKEEIYKIDDQIDSKQKERNAIMEAPVSKEDYLLFIAQEIKDGHNNFDKRLEKALKAQPRTIPAMVRSLESPFLRAHILTPAHENYALYYFGDLILEGVKKVVDGWDWPDNATPYKERLILVKQIDDDLEDLNKSRDELAAQLLELSSD